MTIEGKEGGEIMYSPSWGVGREDNFQKRHWQTLANLKMGKD